MNKFYSCPVVKHPGKSLAFLYFDPVSDEYYSFMINSGEVIVKFSYMVKNNIWKIESDISGFKRCIDKHSISSSDLHSLRKEIINHEIIEWQHQITKYSQRLQYLKLIMINDIYVVIEQIGSILLAPSRLALANINSNNNTNNTNNIANNK